MVVVVVAAAAAVGVACSDVRLTSQPRLTKINEVKDRRISAPADALF